MSDESIFRSICQFLNFPTGVSERKKEIADIEKSLPSKRLKFVSKIEDESLNHFMYAFNLYCLGFFTETIVQSTLAVEIGLANWLNSEFKEEQKKKIKSENKYGVTFGILIGLAKKPLSNEPIVKSLSNINKVRNCHLHYSTFIEQIKESAKAQLEEINQNSFFSYFQTNSKADLELLARFPDLSWCSKEESREFLSNRMKNFFADMDKWFKSTEYGKELEEHGSDEKTWMTHIMRKFNYDKKDALDVLTWSHEVLKYLNVL